jgi:hypothetical protein
MWQSRIDCGEIVARMPMTADLTFRQSKNRSDGIPFPKERVGLREFASGITPHPHPSPKGEGLLPAQVNSQRVSSWRTLLFNA